MSKTLDTATIAELEAQLAVAKRAEKARALEKMIPDVKKLLLQNDAALDTLAGRKKWEIEMILKRLPDYITSAAEDAESEIAEKRELIDRRAAARSRRDERNADDVPAVTAGSAFAERGF